MASEMLIPKNVTALLCVYEPQTTEHLILCHQESVPLSVKTVQPNWNYSTR